MNLNFKKEIMFSLKFLFVLSMLVVVIDERSVNAETSVKSADEKIRYLSAAALREPMQMPGEPAKLNINFDESQELKAWLLASGKWHVEGWVKHNHLRCGSYQLGVRFGKGEFACSNVKWLSEVKYVAGRKQCNQSVLHHQGNVIDEGLVDIFDEITCAQLTIKCSGHC